MITRALEAGRGGQTTSFLEKFEMHRSVVLTVALWLFGSASLAHGAEWVEGKHYVRIQPALRTSVAPGKVEVAEAFSYGCIYCNMFLPTMDKIKASLPHNAEIVYVPASFNPSEQWPMFQRAFLAAQAMGILGKTHEQMFKAVWTTGELAVVDLKTNRIKQPGPTIEAAAKFYQRVAGVKAEQFLATANSFAVATKMKQADAWIKGAKVSGTPSLVVNGKYRVVLQAVRTTEDIVAVVNWLVAKESGGL
jgi:protein dithiol oxidoreductase (disulfide-forming)